MSKIQQEAIDARLYDGTVPMADGGDTRMTAAEEVLAWLLIEKIGVPDDGVGSGWGRKDTLRHHDTKVM
ncbi:hypothetical protein IFT84_20390 [Rhizobium sp. CFBP 8762]|uniref:hypothetical protein n=1 Tax=Rhizobium sp. CFBP 8762 TaxID=2775279 RepID=UPI001783BC4F|nr:hypothetical protein [Rhizobium sp. CFBP 8762]MBD8556873.1 hypothetical protein [Rhizobium sp. CFBP 8762]